MGHSGQNLRPSQADGAHAGGGPSLVAVLSPHSQALAIQ